MHAVPTEQLRALVNLLSPDEITPTASRMLLAAADQHDQCVESVDPDGKPNGYCRRCFKDMNRERALSTAGIFREWLTLNQ